MYRTYLVSTKMESAGYDQETKVMEIEYRDGSIIQYFDVPWELNRDFMITTNRDRFFETNIEGNFQSKILKE